MSDIVKRLRQLEGYAPTPALQSLGAEAADEIEKGYAAMKENSELRIEIERLRADNHSLWGSLRNRMAADAARTLPR